MNDNQITPELMLCFGVYRLQHAFGALYKPLLAPLGLTYAQYLVMTVLWDGGQLSGIPCARARRVFPTVSMPRPVSTQMP